MDYLILVSEPSPDGRRRDGRCTVAWVVHTQMANATREYAQGQAARIKRILGLPVLLVESAWQLVLD